LYYEKDKNFYIEVLKAEETGEFGFEFKIMIILPYDQNGVSTEMLEAHILQILTDLDGVDIRTRAMEG
jgi:hypothetical protein